MTASNASRQANKKRWERNKERFAKNGLKRLNIDLTSDVIRSIEEEADKQGVKRKNLIESTINEKFEVK